MFESKVLNIPVVKVFAMTDEGNHPFILSFHCSNPVSGICFKVTPSRSNPVTKVPVYEGTCYTINTFMDMLTAYGCKYVRRLPIGKGEILSKDYLDGLADSSIIAKQKTKTVCCCNCENENSSPKNSTPKSEEEIVNDFLKYFKDEYDNNWQEFLFAVGILP